MGPLEMFNGGTKKLPNHFRSHRPLLRRTCSWSGQSKWKGGTEAFPSSLLCFCKNSGIGAHGRSVKIQPPYLGMRCLSSAPVWARPFPGSHVLLHICLQRLALSSHLFPDAPIPYSLSTAPRLYIWVSSISVRLAANSSVWLSQSPSPLLYSYHFSPVASSFF